MTFTLGQFFPKKTLNEPFLALNDPRWDGLEGGYHGTPCNAAETLLQLEQAKTLKDANAIYQELWDELHHQGDVGPASYYAVPHLIRIAIENSFLDYNVFGLVTLIEICRHKANPEFPKLLLPAYQQAITDLGQLAISTINTDWDNNMASTVLAAIAMAKGKLNMAEAILNLDSDDVIEAFLENF